MVFHTAPISIPARVVSGGHCKNRFPQGSAVQNRRPLYRISQKSAAPAGCDPAFLHIRTSNPTGAEWSIFRVFILHEIEKPPVLFSVATFTKDEMRAKKLLTFGVHLAMIQPTKTQ